MDLPWSSITLASAGGSIVLVQLTPAYSIHASYTQTFTTLFVLGTIATAFYDVILYPHFFSPFRHLPSPPGASFWNGHFKRILEEPSGAPQQDWINSVQNDGLICYRHLLNRERLLLTSPQALAEVLTQKSYEFIKPKQLRNGLARVLGIGLILAEGDEHKAQRKNLMPAFAFRHIKDLYPVFWSKSCKLVTNLMAEVRGQDKEYAQNLSSASVIEISNWASRAALDIIGVAGMGQDFNALDDPDTELNVTYRKVFQSTRSGAILAIMGFFLPPWLVRAIPVDYNNVVVEASETIKKVGRELIRQKEAELRSQEKRTEPDILSVALESGAFTEENLVNQLMTFLAAGHETTASALTWTIYLLCHNPEVQSRLREEIRASLPSIASDQQITSQTIENCAYLHAVCSESLRLHAPVPLTLREAVRNTTLQGQPVPKGTRIIVPCWAVNTSVALWGADAATFRPERWMGPGKAGNGGAESNYAFLTFLHGPRSCIGQAFARAEFAALLAAVVGRFEFELEDTKKVEIKKSSNSRLESRVSRGFRHPAKRKVVHLHSEVEVEVDRLDFPLAILYTINPPPPKSIDLFSRLMYKMETQSNLQKIIKTRTRLIIHGGAGNITPSHLPPKQWTLYKSNLLQIYHDTDDLLQKGVSALDAATHAVTLFEDCELFNCGKGAVGYSYPDGARALKRFEEKKEGKKLTAVSAA
ncbi:MAG: hypothetical protein Q9217_000481 [Psora testacea]